jgi:polysaccharide pyruvyl transferase CsaB
MKHILISGYYGFNNIGDEAVLGGLLTGLREGIPDVEPVVLSGDPAQTAALHGVTAIPRMSRQTIRTELRRADLLISGGGSLLQDVTSFRSPLYYLGVLWLAQRMQVPTMMCAQGVGPLDSPINRFLARRILNRVRAITVRDEGSAEFLRALGVDKPPVEVTADPSFLLAPDASARLDEWWAANIPAGRPVIGAALRYWKSSVAEERYTAIADALAAIAQAAGATILFLPMQREVDLGIAEEMSGWTPAENRVCTLALTPREMLAAIGRCDFLAAMRLHALIFAVHRGVPAFGISYDPKVRDFAHAARLPMPLDWDEIETGLLTEELRTQWDNRNVLRTTLATSAANLTTLARWNIERVKDLLT